MDDSRIDQLDNFINDVSDQALGWYTILREQPAPVLPSTQIGSGFIGPINVDVPVLTTTSAGAAPPAIAMPANINWMLIGAAVLVAYLFLRH